MKTEISSYLETSQYIQDQLIPFYSSEAGRLMFSRTERVLEDQLPQYVREVEGLARGAGQDFRTMMMLNINFPSGGKDILDKGCTSLLVPAGASGQPRVLGHTEDGPPRPGARCSSWRWRSPPVRTVPGSSSQPSPTRALWRAGPWGSTTGRASCGA